MGEDGIVPDSSFYICFTNDLKRRECFYEVANLYSVYIGRRILKEICKEVSGDKNFLSTVRIINFDYYELIKPYFGRNEDHIDDGEYEAIGIAHFLAEKGYLKYLIIDETRAKNFVTKHFPYLINNTVGTIGFIRDSCCKDRKISTSKALGILNAIKEAVDSGKTNRPCSMDTKSYKNILIPTIEIIRKTSRDYDE
ncbi:MAG: hypothetical protein O8C64_11415 [Candidatus Methanoperedens sp.]|nr:hypothetical protein [Candidatus Methanoperedens sp.]MCZ7406078.1 hypothetical protein [Candidatus Methanoperedens sp.]